MTTPEWSWHESQSAKIRTADRTIREAESTIAFAWWEAGEKLNSVYGPPAGTGTREGRVPGSDMARLCEIYRVTDPVIRQARRFHGKCRDRDAALRVIDDYGTWLNITRGFLPGLDADETREQILGRKREDYQDRARAYHMNNVPDRLVAELVLKGGLPEPEARQAIRYFIERVSYLDVLTPWRARKKVAEATA